MLRCFLIIAAIVGFFVTVAAVWILMPAHPATSAHTRRMFGATLIGGVVVAVALGVFAYLYSGETQAVTPETGAPPEANSIAVLPFVNMSGDLKQDYFSDGISEELDYMALPQFVFPAAEKAVQLDRYNLALYRMVEKRYAEAARIARRPGPCNLPNPICNG